MMFSPLNAFSSLLAYLFLLKIDGIVNIFLNRSLKKMGERTYDIAQARFSP
jgi:hypothetical protein